MEDLVADATATDAVEEASDISHGKSDDDSCLISTGDTDCNEDDDYLGRKSIESSIDRTKDPTTPKQIPRGAGESVKKSKLSTASLSIPFRTIKKAMKLDPDTPIVQNEAAMMTTVATELFLKRLAAESHRCAKHRGRNTIRYEDIAEGRTTMPSLAFLETLLP